jgi:hypothetical protein
VDPILKIPITKRKRAGRVAQGEGPEFKLQYHKKKKKERNFPYLCIIYSKLEFS